MPDKNNYLTPEKHSELVKELHRLKTERRKEVAENLEYAKALGDFSENAEYHEAREAQAVIEDRINKLEAILKSAVIVSGHHGEKIDIGSNIVIEKAGGENKINYKIVGSEEADLSKGKLSIHSPLGGALVGKRKGDKAVFTSPAGSAVEYKILEVN